MKILGKELKFNGFDIWHKDNFNPDNKVDNSRVLTDVPSGAKFTDTTYSEITTSEIDGGTSTTLRTITGRRIKYIFDKVEAMISNAISNLTKSNVGLGNVDNTSDLDKPISTAAQTALNNKSDKGHIHNISDETTGNLSTDRLLEPSYRTGSITPTAKPLFDVLRADRTAFLPESQIIIEKSIDGGVTWQDAQITDTIKRKLFTGQRPSIVIPLKNGVKSCDCLIRVTITGMKYDVPDGTIETEKYNYWNSNYIKSTERYFAAQEGWTWVSSNSDRIYLKVERATGANPNNWLLDREAYLSGWSGGNFFSLSGNTFGGGTTQVNNYWNWRFTFRTCSTKNTFNDVDLSTSYINASQTIFHIKIVGQNVWTAPNNYMYHDHLYNWDEYQNAVFPAEIKANTFRKSDGTEVAYKNEIPTDTSELTKSDVYTKTEVNTKLDGKVDNSRVLTDVPLNAKFTDTIYTHPSTHPASMITESTTRRFVSDTEKANWNGKAEISDIPTKVGQLENDKNYVTSAELGNAGYGDMVRSVYDTNNNGIVDNAEKVNGFTVETNVPANAKFTDTIYTHPSTHPASMITGLHSVATSGIADKLSIVDTRSIDSPPSYYFGQGKNMFWEFKYRSSVGNPPTNASASGTYAFILTITGWGDSSGGYPVQISVGGQNIAIRQGISTTTWGSWHVMANIDDLPTKLSQLQIDTSLAHVGTSAPSNKNTPWIDTSL